MAFKNVTLSVEAYDALAKEKKGKESFSDVVLRVVPKRSIMEFAGMLTNEQADELRRNVAELRKNFKVHEWPS